MECVQLYTLFSYDPDLPSPYLIFESLNLCWSCLVLAIAYTYSFLACFAWALGWCLVFFLLYFTFLILINITYALSAWFDSWRVYWLIGVLLCGTIYSVGVDFFFLYLNECAF